MSILSSVSRPAIRLDAATLTLAGPAGAVNVLRGVSLQVATGEQVAIVGASGSGKTSLLSLIAGLERASSGRVEVAGEDFTRLDEEGLARFRRLHLGIVFQSFHLLPAMTALENVAVPLELLGRKNCVEQARERLEALGLGHRIDHYPAQLSGGEQQRVALARAVIAGPSLVLADEPTGNLDSSTGRLVADLLFAECARIGATLVLITHEADLAARCGRRIELADGRVISDSAHG